MPTIYIHYCTLKSRLRDHNLHLLHWLSEQLSTPNREIIETRGKIDTCNTHIHVHDDSLSWLGRGTSINSGRVKLVLWSWSLLFWNPWTISSQYKIRINLQCLYKLIFSCFIARDVNFANCYSIIEYMLSWKTIYVWFREFY